MRFEGICKSVSPEVAVPLLWILPCRKAGFEPADRLPLSIEPGNRLFGLEIFVHLSGHHSMDE